MLCTDFSPAQSVVLENYLLDSSRCLQCYRQLRTSELRTHLNQRCIGIYGKNIKSSHVYSRYQISALRQVSRQSLLGPNLESDEDIYNSEALDMIKHIRLRTCVIFYVIFIASFIIPLPVRAKIRGINIVPAAILDWYSVILDDFRYHSSQEQLHIIMSFLVFLLAHLAIVTLISLFISWQFTDLVSKCKPRKLKGDKTGKAIY